MQKCVRLIAMRVALITLIGFLTAFPALAANFRIYKSDQETLIISMKGEIKPNDPAKLKRIVSSNRFAGTRIIYLNSDGGLVEPALKLGLLVRAYGLTTAIASNARCYSACSMVFVAGRTANGTKPSRIKFRGGELGVHRPYLESTGYADPQVIRQVRSYLQYMNAGKEFYRLTVTTSSTTMRVIGDSELKAMGNYRIAQAKSYPYGLARIQKSKKSNKQSAYYAKSNSQANLERWRRSFLENND